MRILKRAVLGLILLGLLTTGGIWFWLDHQSPRLSGTITTDKIGDETRITRDKWGVPHIQASSGADAYFALGFTVAQDRLFQMELQRRLAQGELAEILGPTLLDVDKKFRTLLLRDQARAYLEKEADINPRALAFLDDFLSGINHFIDTEPLPAEYALLGFKPRPFTRLDTVSMLGYVAYSFADGIKRDSLQTILAARLSPGDMDLIFPDYTLDNRVTVMEPGGVPRPEETAARTAEASGTDAFKGFVPAIQRLLDKSVGISPPFTGSNSWVLAPSRTRSGHALLANDPHIGIANPGVWYEAHVSYPGYENYGYHLPLLPFPMLAHNRTKAWALTMFENDDLDLYGETFDPRDPGRVMFNGEWTSVEIREEAIKVKGEADVTLTIRITPHGPVISDVLDGYEGRPVSLCWVYHKLDNPILDVVFDMACANTMDEFRSALAGLAAPGLNISYVDASGNIGWWAAGRIPIRPAHAGGKEIHDGSSGRDEWQGYLPFHRNPQMENPENGMIITANNLSTLRPIDPVGVLTGYFRPSDRAARIYELLTQKERWDIRELQAVQTDTRLHSGSSMAGAILEVLDTRKENFSGQEARARDALSSWDGFMGTESIGGTVFQFTVYHLIKQALEPHIGPENLKAYLNQADHWSFLKRMFKTGKTIAGNGQAGSVAYQDLVLAGFREAVRELSEKHGSDPAGWTWGNIHTIEFVHAVGRKKPLDRLYNIGPFPCPAEFTSVNKLKSNTGNHDYKVVSVPSTRRLIDCNDPEGSWSILPSGNSGNVMSPFYDDQAGMFVSGQYRQILFTPAQFTRGNAGTLTIKPE